ncbi:MAG: hypothetical protein O3B33_07240 [Proteobacteria bacterium]|nr:hypothetical protein [Pseudomonadota bacterium]
MPHNILGAKREHHSDDVREAVGIEFFPVKLHSHRAGQPCVEASVAVKACTADQPYVAL